MRTCCHEAPMYEGNYTRLHVHKLAHGRLCFTTEAVAQHAFVDPIEAQAAIDSALAVGEITSYGSMPHAEMVYEGRL